VKAAREGSFDYTATPSGGATNLRVPYNYNTGENLWDNTNERFTAPFTGEYVIGGSFMATPNNCQYMWTQIRIYNSSGTLTNAGDQLGMYTPGNSIYSTVHFYTTYDLNAGDYIEVWYHAQAYAGTVCGLNLHGHWGQINIHCLRRY
jgi:hypothetical protein